MTITKVYFDTEFTGLHKDTSLISIGLVTDDEDVFFYAELEDYDLTQVDDWIQSNVIDNLLIKYSNYLQKGIYTEGKPFSVEIRDGKAAVREELRAWLDQFDKVEFVSDVSHYDFVLLIDLVYGHALKMPYGKINAACHDLNQDIADHLNISEIEAFDKSREELLEELDTEVYGVKHNALYDAKVIRAIYNGFREKHISCDYSKLYFDNKEMKEWV